MYISVNIFVTLFFLHTLFLCELTLSVPDSFPLHSLALCICFIFVILLGRSIFLSTFDAVHFW